MRQSDRQSGFSIVEALIVVVVIGIIGTSSWFVYQHNRVKTTNAAAGGTPPSSQQSTTTTTTPPPANNQTVIKIPELGIQITVPDDMKDIGNYSGVLPKSEKVRSRSCLT